MKRKRKNSFEIKFSFKGEISRVTTILDRPLIITRKKWENLNYFMLNMLKMIFLILLKILPFVIRELISFIIKINEY